MSDKLSPPKVDVIVTASSPADAEALLKVIGTTVETNPTLGLEKIAIEAHDGSFQLIEEEPA